MATDLIRVIKNMPDTLPARSSAAASSKLANLYVETLTIKPKLTYKYFHGGSTSYRRVLWRGATWSASGPISPCAALAFTSSTVNDTLDIVHDGKTFTLTNTVLTGVSTAVENRGGARLDIGTMTGTAEYVTSSSGA